MVDPRFYNIKPPMALAQIAKDFNCQLIGNIANTNLLIEGIDDLSSADKTKVSLFFNPKYKQQFLTTNAAACLVKNGTQSNENTFLLACDNPYYVYAKLIDAFYSGKQSASATPLQNGSYISKKAIIGDGCHFGYGVVIEDNVSIGNNCVIDSHCIIKQGVTIANNATIGAGSYISYAQIGNNFTTLCGAKIGCDGFGFAPHQGKNQKIFHVGKVIIGDDVEIGAGTTIDRGSINDTIIGAMTKIDNLVQLGHNVVIGKGCFIAGQVGISGSTKIGNYCAIGGQTGIAGHLAIADLVQIAGASGVVSDICQAGVVFGGYPAIPIRKWHKQSLYLRKIIEK
jgi:UDP-3-O-[3-hydroxymyristoyl] glucosamine N-acyltransferase